MQPTNTSIDQDAQLDAASESAHTLPNKTTSAHEEANNHLHRPEQSICGLVESAARLSGRDDAFGQSGSGKRSHADSREGELVRLAAEPAAPELVLPLFAEGGEHRVYGTAQPGDLIKQTLPGYYGRILEERMLLDPRTFMNERKLAMRGALPSEYLRRWAIMADIFGLVSTYLGQVPNATREPQMAVSQPFIAESEDDPATLDDVAQLMTAHGFERVPAALIINPEVQEVTWYRPRDGVLITDAHARNVRKDMSGLIIPIDLVIGLVDVTTSTLLPAPDKLWTATL